MSEVSEHTSQNIFKNKGHFESQGEKPLPPTYITKEAQKRLESWGFTREEMDDIRYFTSQFRYDLCPEKVARIAQTPAEVYSINGQDYINLPTFRDAKGRLDGQCGDIGAQWIIQINESNLIRKLNQRSRNRVTTAFYNGLSETHYCQEGMNHVWNGLALLGRNGDILDEIYIDAAFQVISSKQESKYNQSSASYGPTKSEISENVEVPIGWVEIEGYSWQGNIVGNVVLGISSDYKFGYGLSFLRDKRTKMIRPILRRILKDGRGEHYIIGNENQILTSDKTIASPSRDDEIQKILQAAQKIEFVDKLPTQNTIVWEKNQLIF